MTLSGFCDCCGKPKSAGSLNLVCVNAPRTGPKWVLLCGPCFVDGEESHRDEVRTGTSW